MPRKVNFLHVAVVVFTVACAIFIFAESSFLFTLTKRAHAAPKSLSWREPQSVGALHAPSWISDDPQIRLQELVQWDWESSLRQQETHVAADTIRSDFHRRMEQAAASPSNQEQQRKALAMLKNATKFFDPRNKDKIPPYNKNQVFDDILVAVKLDNDFITAGPGRAGQRNHIIGGNDLLLPLNGSCVVYGAGIAYETSFEVEVARSYGCAVHAFDCTMTNKALLQLYLDRQKNHRTLAFHPWCIGEEQKIEASNITQGKAVYDYRGFKGNMFTLDTIATRLGHDEIDILKFDIEGHEWDLFEVLLKGNKLPRQLQFELHAKGANRGYVPEYLSHDKDQDKVVHLFQRLYDLGYRVVTKERNHGDFACAEFVLYQFHI